MQKSVQCFLFHILSSLKIRFSDPRLSALGVVNHAYVVGSYHEHFPANSSSHDLLISIFVLLPVSSTFRTAFFDLTEALQKNMK